jgi:hypothetical protein
MRKNLLSLSILFCCSYFNLNAQLIQDDFSDGDFTNNPEWTGDINDFIVNDAFHLQLNFEEETLRPAYISTLAENDDLNEKEWRFDVSLDFSPSNSNKVEIYLASTTGDIRDFENAESIQEGYYLEIGENGSDDGISLFYRNGENTQLIARGGDGDFASAFDVRIRVRRDADANWEIAVDPNKGENFTEYNVSEYRTERTFNEIYNVQNGMWGKKMVGQDLFDKKLKYEEWDYNSEWDASVQIDGKNEKLREDFDTKKYVTTEFVPYNENQDLYPSYKANEWNLRRMSMLQQFNNYKLNVNLEGDTNIRLGMKIYFKFPSHSHRNDGRENEVLKGFWLITRILNECDQRTHKMFTELKKPQLKSFGLQKVIPLGE